MNRKSAAIPRATNDVTLPMSLPDVLDSVEDDLLVIDSSYHIRFANTAARNKFSKVVASPVGSRCYEIFQGRDMPCSAPLWDCPLREVLRSGRAKTFIHPVGTPRTDTYLKITSYPLRDRDGKIQAVVELRRDVTAERELETQVLRRHHQLLALSRISAAVSGLSDLNTVLNVALDNVLEVINSTIGGILLVEKDSGMLCYRVQRGFSPKYVNEMCIPVGEGIAGTVAKTGEPILVEDVSKDPRAARRDLISAEGIKGGISIPLKAKDKVVGVMNVVSHVVGRFSADEMSLLNSIGDYLGTAIEQARLYEQLARVGERYKKLLHHALTAQEEERKRIARELHDETSQALTSLTLSMQAIIGMAELKGIHDEEFIKRLKTTHAYAVHAGREIVRLMKELRPTLLDELGMAAAIHRYAKDTLLAKSIDVAAEFKGTDGRFPPEVEVTLFRVAQGAIGNILEHSEAKKVSISLECSDTQCAMCIADDGKGFDVSKITRVDPSGRGAGLFTMKERIRLVGGNCHIDSSPGNGTRITARVPLTGEIDEDDKSVDS